MPFQSTALSPLTNAEGTTILKLDGKYTIFHEDGLNIRATRYDNQMWRDFVGDKLMYVLVTQYTEMLELLHQVNEATGPGAVPQQLTDALLAVSKHIEQLPK